MFQDLSIALVNSVFGTLKSREILTDSDLYWIHFVIFYTIIITFCYILWDNARTLRDFLYVVVKAKSRPLKYNTKGANRTYCPIHPYEVYIYLVSGIALYELICVTHFPSHDRPWYIQLVLLVWIEYKVDNLLLSYLPLTLGENGGRLEFLLNYLLLYLLWFFFSCPPFL